MLILAAQKIDSYALIVDEKQRERGAAFPLRHKLNKVVLNLEADKDK
jgi:hypothetical protein